jgi:hypothetical protein
MYLTNDEFQYIVQKRYNIDFGEIPLANHGLDGFGIVDHLFDTEIYKKLIMGLNPVIQADVRGFYKFFLACLRKHLDIHVNTTENFTIADISDSLELQVLFILCMQYYFV